MGVFQIRVKVEKNPELGFSISGGVGGRGNPFRPDDNVNERLDFIKFFPGTTQIEGTLLVLDFISFLIISGYICDKGST